MENSFVVITNASSGIGQELARQFGNENLELLICSESDEIFAVQSELEHEGHVVEAMKVNLGTYNGVENLFYRIRNYGKRLDSMVINTDSNIEGYFLDNDLRSEIKSINNNIISTIHLVKRVLTEMTEREDGNILISLTSSADAIDSANLSFIHTFVDSIRKEIKGRGVCLTLLNIDSDQESDLEESARYAIESMRAGKGNVYPDSIIAKIHNYATRIIPEKARTHLARH
jgi:short-subunit dehydrogenase